MTEPSHGSPRLRCLVVGAGAIGGVVGGSLLAAGHDVSLLTTNARIGTALQSNGFVLAGRAAHIGRVTAGPVFEVLPPGAGPFDAVFLATQPPQVEEAARSVLPHLGPSSRVVCFQNGLCEERIAGLLGRDRVVGGVVAWGASMPEPGHYERTSLGGFTLGRLEGPHDRALSEIAGLLEAVGPVRLTDNLLGARWSKLAINAAISTLGTIGGDRVGVLMRHAFVRRLVLEIMTETVQVARACGVRLEKVAGTVDLDWLALTGRESGPDLVARHAVLLAAGFRYRRLRSSMLGAIERGRPPAVDFLNGEVLLHGARHGLGARVNQAAGERVWQIARGEARSSLDSLRSLYEATR